ncbi:tetratricopeptide repeat-containing sensor histidine kinase [Dokdonia sp. Hel_I_53]|uniref:tetratricopeptide repeat-containing sensor histidine kinase n=1 Tax=Dokdonia sp. Hel_I_53 TaxID=1566287 RepID=UPI00119B11C0|nr:tetratricopeptide repeat-containing sensor histidine kinase [Dokdonia sp. Hel_I_53]TVZ52382.1 hypothetical protein OD90_1557 [Dokdonia sp. Hel_I_53]
MNKIIVLLVLTGYLCNFNISAQNNSDLLLDSLKKRAESKSLSFDERLLALERIIPIAKNISDSLYFRVLDYRLTLLNISGNYDGAILEADNLISLSRKSGEPQITADTYKKKGRLFAKQKKQLQAFKNYSRALELYTILKDSLKFVMTSKSLSFIQSQKGDLVGAEYTIVNALDYSNAVKDKSELAWFYDVLGRIYRERSLWQEAIQNHRKALQLENSPKSRVSLLNNYAITLTKARRYNDAMNTLNIALEYNSITDPIMRYRLLDNFAFVKGKLGATDAIELLEKSLKSRQEINDAPGEYASHIHLSEIFASQNNDTKARYHAQQAYNIARQLQNTEAIVRALDFLIPVTEQSNVLFGEYSALSDSLTSAQNKAKFEFAKLRFDVEKAEERESIALNAQSASELREYKAVRRRNWAFAGLISFLLIGTVFLLYQQERIKKQRLLDTYNTEKRIAKKLHDELANEIYLVMTQLEDTRTQPVLADKLEHIYKLTRDISRETQPISTDNSFSNELALSLQNYTSDDRKLILRGLESVNWNQIDGKKKIEIYRVLQELMTNMRKHSKASFVALVFKEFTSILEINYSDNGKGVFLRENVLGGLENMDSRLASIGGTIKFDSAVNEGFRAEISIPI